jgi:formylglycine-generating enzyme required for sulfatase activity
MRFYPVSEGIFIKGAYNGEQNVELDTIDPYSFPHEQTVPRFFIMESEVTKEQYRSFINENSYWSLSNKKVLMGEGKVDEHYLESWDSLEENQPVNFVSFYAAEAFCQWASLKIPGRIQGYRLALPTETYWEYVAKEVWEDSAPVLGAAYAAGPAEVNRIGGRSRIKQMRGNLWEWCGNWYFPMDYFFEPPSLDDEDEILINRGREKAIRGGSWANRDDEISPFTRGSHPPSWCTPFIGFRPVLVPK